MSHSDASSPYLSFSEEDEHEQGVDPQEELHRLHDEQLVALEVAKKALAELNRRTMQSVSKEKAKNSAAEFSSPTNMEVPVHQVLSAVIESVQRAESANERAKRKLEDIEDEEEIRTSLNSKFSLQTKKKATKKDDVSE